jgi:Ca-activated chloride channel family protein
VIDISGDGAQNAGVLLPPVRSDVLSRGIEINAVAIEELGLPITEFYRRHVISPGGFVMTARGHLDYPRAIRDKILREVVRPGA